MSLSSWTFKQKVYGILALSGIFHLLACWASVGFYHFDEHFQVLEFANLKMGHITGADLPWEYTVRARPWMQSAVYYWIMCAFQALGGKSPFALAFVLRLFTSAVGFVGNILLSRCCLRWFRTEREQLWAIVTLNLIWFMPYLHARTSSENLATSCFAIGLALFVLEAHVPFRLKTAAMIGFLYGLAFEFRFQVCFMIAGFLAWTLYYRKLHWSRLFMLGGSAVVVLAAGVAVDSWGYDQFTLTLWQYFKTNFIDGALVNGGEDPWWFYFHYMLVVLPPLSLLVALGAFREMYRQPQHVLTWICLPFLLFHIVVGHKEARYLFPVYMLAPLMAVYSGAAILKYRRWCGFFVFLNFATMLNLALSPAKRQIAVYEFAYHENPQRFAYFVQGDDPFRPSGLQPLFYTRQVQRLGTVESERQLPELAAQVGPYYFVTETETSAPFCKKIWDNFPVWADSDWGRKILKRVKVRSWFIYDCRQM